MANSLRLPGTDGCEDKALYWRGERTGNVLTATESDVTHLLATDVELRDRILGPLGLPSEEQLRTLLNDKRQLHEQLAHVQGRCEQIKKDALAEAESKLKTKHSDSCEAVQKHFEDKVRELERENDRRQSDLASAHVVLNLCKCPSADTVANRIEKLDCVKATRELERERDEARAQLRAELDGNLDLGKRHGQREDETFRYFVARLAHERDDFRQQLASCRVVLNLAGVPGDGTVADGIEKLVEAPRIREPEAECERHKRKKDHHLADYNTVVAECERLRHQHEQDVLIHNALRSDREAAVRHKEGMEAVVDVAKEWQRTRDRPKSAEAAILWDRVRALDAHEISGEGSSVPTGAGITEGVAETDHSPEPSPPISPAPPGLREAVETLLAEVAEVTCNAGYCHTFPLQALVLTECITNTRAALAWQPEPTGLREAALREHIRTHAAVVRMLVGTDDSVAEPIREYLHSRKREFMAAPAQPAEKERSCETCQHRDINRHIPPCCECLPKGLTMWQPKLAEEKLLGNVYTCGFCGGRGTIKFAEPVPVHVGKTCGICGEPNCDPTRHALTAEPEPLPRRSARSSLHVGPPRERAAEPSERTIDGCTVMVCRHCGCEHICAECDGRPKPAEPAVIVGGSCGVCGRSGCDPTKHGTGRAGEEGPAHD